MLVTFWGTRGSVPTPGPATVRYGGNTSCVEVQSEGGTRFVLDSGTGIRELGLRLARDGAPVDAHILLGHTHWDHISGFPFFTPAFVPGNRFVVYGARTLDRPLREVLAGQMHTTYFPVPLGDLRADLQFRELDEGELRIGEVTVRTHQLNHTATCIGYRLEGDGVSLAYVTDHEPYVGRNGANSHASLSPKLRTLHEGDRRLMAFVRGVDLLIQDAQYTPEEYAAKKGWGHGSTDYVTDIALEAGVRRLALFHHEPTHSDDEIDAMVTFCRERVRQAGGALDVFAAAEGQQLTV